MISRALPLVSDLVLALGFSQWRFSHSHDLIHHQHNNNFVLISHNASILAFRLDISFSCALSPLSVNATHHRFYISHSPFLMLIHCSFFLENAITYRHGSHAWRIRFAGRSDIEALSMKCAKRWRSFIYHCVGSSSIA